MVIDKVNGLSIPRYLVYDIIKFENEDIAARSFVDRLECIDKEIILPRHEAMKRGQIQREREPFSVRKKMFWDVMQAGALLGEKFAKTLSHEPDGLIFQPKMDVSCYLTRLSHYNELNILKIISFPALYCR